MSSKSSKSGYAEMLTPKASRGIPGFTKRRPVGGMIKATRGRSVSAPKPPTSGRVARKALSNGSGGSGKKSVRSVSTGNRPGGNLAARAKKSSRGRYSRR